MLNPPNVSKGDRVRVVFEGDVTDTAESWFDIDGRISVWPSATYIQSVEVLPQLVKVGDEIPKASAPEVFDALPVGTVLRITAARPGEQDEHLLFKTVNGWVGGHGKPYSTSSILAGRTVAYLPGLVS